MQRFACGMYRNKRSDDYFVRNDFEFCRLNYELLPIKLRPFSEFNNDFTHIIIKKSQSHLINSEYYKIFTGKKYNLYSKDKLIRKEISSNKIFGAFYYQIIFFIISLLLTIFYGSRLLNYWTIEATHKLRKGVFNSVILNI